MVRLIKSEPVSIGQRLKQLIQEGIQDGRFTDQQDFCQKFNEWYKKAKYPEHGQFLVIYPKDVSRWIRGRVTPRMDKIRLFAEFFDVNPEWIACTADRTRFNGTSDEFNHLSEEWKQIEQEAEAAQTFWNQVELFRKYLESIRYTLEAIPTDYEQEQVMFRTYQNGMEYTWTEDTATATDQMFIVTYPDHSSVNLTEEQVTALLKRIQKQIELEFSLMKGEKE